MFSRILIANRGEIALRIIRACRELGVQSVVVYSEADEGAQYLKLADGAIRIGAAPAGESYLRIDRILSAAEVADVQAIHPGYGFLAENPKFAEQCRGCNIEFIGPSTAAMELLGNKVEARRMAKEARVAITPGSETSVKSPDEALEMAHKIGFPVILKAAGGGGGRGMRVAHNDITLRKNFSAAQTEAEAAFKDPSIYVEKYLERARHVEVQILADHHGTIIHLGERDCTIQRRHQKLIEEAPSPGISDEVRYGIRRAAVRLAHFAGYTNAGTVEFLVDENDRYYFCEVNARVQVEHPVTEMVTGVDIIKEQIRIAAGEKLRLRQRRIQPSGVAIECRINAEDTTNGFRPTPGRIDTFIAPGGPGVRLDTHVHAGYLVPPNYDSLLAKVIVHQKTRRDAIACMVRALEEFQIRGVPTTIPLCLTILRHSQFLRGKVHTKFVEEMMSGGP
jgi:acetyl-CoA carboxylase biotin carboxylase subunit